MVNTPTLHGQWIPDEYKKGLVTVIVPTYNRANILPEALDSVWAQTYRPIELIVVDDGSIDDTRTAVELWQRDHQGDDQFELRYFHKENSGVCSARNLGLGESKGEYIQFLDSDDAFYPAMVDRAARAFVATGCGFVLVGYDKICHDCGRTLYKYVPEPDTDAWAMYMKGKLFGNSISIVRRRSLIQEIGPWDESLINDADGNYLVRTILHSSRMAVVRERLFVYLVRHGPKLCDTKGSHKSWMCYVQRERMFCEGIKGKEGILAEARDAYAQRLYQLALSLYNGGLPEIGSAFGQLAEGVHGTLSLQGKLMQRFWWSARGLYSGYEWLGETKHRIRKFLSGEQKKGPACPVCGG